MKALEKLPEIQETLNKDNNHPMHGFAVIYSQQVEWGDMDSFGHVNNVVYYTYAQNARIHYNSQLNLFNKNTFSVMAASSCQYFKPVVYPDTLWIGVRIKKIGNASLIHEYTYYSTAMNTIVASGESVLVYLDKATGQKKNIDETKKAAISAFERVQ
ncbi:acyl-CoA thioesterase [Psychrobacter cryohalolentis]|uniref:Thioesterase superfamily n=1 Tax=Psychrobacter cryohalolentis (strain ATCC BAA-1226 / DSM 17306 / VKM B-2378 / K5) TaxID=335284 RepID=Q1QBD4_PSYCK|nr:thioesterase family protein [Psychrobacter cryohalolentis]ABE75019.1 thioesterase superfamily [Psychrobacter cryohalolentis K5]ASE25226.1 acyl-CoA thioesterase [Psychrobacter cryohalolentis]